MNKSKEENVKKAKAIRRNNDQMKKAKKKERKEALIKENKVKKEYKQLSEGNEQRVIRKRRILLVESVLLIVISAILISLICNKTFFREEYKTENVDISIPLLYYFVEDDGKVITFKTLRKSAYDKEYFNSYLENLSVYNCNNEIFYYDEDSSTTIYGVDVEKDFALKTISVYYSNETPANLCK